MCDFRDALVRRCAMCAGGYGSPLCEEKRALSTCLQNFASAAEFLASFDLVSPSAADCDDVDLCNFCLSTVLTCDNVLSLFWRKIAALRDLKSVRIPCELVSCDTEIASYRSASGNSGNVAEVNASVQTAGNPEESLLRRTLLGENRGDEISQNSCGIPTPPPVAASGMTEEDAAADGIGTEETDSSDSNGDEDDDVGPLIPADLPPKRRHRILVHRTVVSNCGARLRICEDCGFGCTTAMQFYRHCNRLHANPDSFKCWECGRRFLTQKELGNHEDTHWKEHFGNVTCIDCRKEIRATSVKVHVDRAHGGRLNRSKAERLSSGRTYAQCFHCDRMCCSDSLVELHMLQAHPEKGDRKVFQCDECPSRYKDKHSLIKHKHVHRMERHECPTCHKTFKLRRGLRQHMKWHTGALFSLCPECGRRISTSHLAHHMATEHGVGEVKYHQCHVCPARYKTSKALRVHLAAKHQIGAVKGDPKYPCEKCEKVLSSKEFRVVHMFNDHGVRLPDLKEYSCMFCEKVFLSRNAHDVHMRKVHGHNASKTMALPLFLCKICSASCAERKSFLEHLKADHDLAVRGRNAYKEFLMSS